MSESSSSGGGIGFAGLLTILFIGLKLTGFIAWPWIWVLSPLWIGFLLAIVIVGIVLLVVGAGYGIGTLGGKLMGLRRTKIMDSRRAQAKEVKTSEKPLGLFDSTGEKVKQRKPHSWMI